MKGPVLPAAAWRVHRPAGGAPPASPCGVDGCPGRPVLERVITAAAERLGHRWVPYCRAHAAMYGALRLPTSSRVADPRAA